jgi:nitrite reductase (NADH) large subunit
VRAPRVRGLRFADGSEIVADLVVMAVGIRPNATLAREAGLHCERALVVDDHLHTSDARILALGECVQHQGATFGLVAPIVDQARVAAAQLAGDAQAAYVQRPFATRLKVSGIDLFSAGAIEPGAQTESLVFSDPRRGVYKHLLLENDRIKGVILYGDVADGSWYFDLLQKGTDISALRDDLLFGRAYLPAAA